MTAIELVGTMVATLAADRVGRRLQGMYFRWRFNRDFRRAQRRMQRCAHAATALVDIGMSGKVPQCTACRALQIQGQWSATTPAVNAFIHSALKRAMK